MRRRCLVALALLLGAAPPASAAPEPARPRLAFTGLAMQSELWSENDVLATLFALEHDATHFEVSGAVFSDRSPPGPMAFLPVVQDEVAPALQTVAADSKPGDVTIVYVSTHGAPGLLGRQLDGEEAAPVGVAEFKRWLEPLKGHDTVLILSACFSGSFIPALAEPHRIIITAARADRPSFGCQAGAQHTVFGRALLQSIAPNRSLREIVDRTRRAVTAAEHELRVSAPSLPQVYVGAAVKPLYDAPVF